MTNTSLQKDASLHVVRNSLLAGSVAGITSTLACHPFDVIRTIMQSASMTTSSSTSASTSTSTSVRGPLHVLSQTLQNGGFRALYTGLALPLAAQAIYKATIFTVNNVTQASIIEWHTATDGAPYSLTLRDHFICGFVAGGVNAALFVTPVEYVRNQLIRHQSLKAAGQALPNAYTGTLDVIRTTIRRSSLLGLWKGSAVTVARDSIGVAFFFGSMQWCQDYFTSQYKYTNNQRQGQDCLQQPTPSFAITILSGALAGLGYWIVALPLDSVKTWVQSDMADSAIQAITTSLRQHGLKRTLLKLFYGYQVAYGRGIPSAAITVTTYSLCYTALQETNKQE
jgi:Mitochondrial carrier protein